MKANFASSITIALCFLITSAFADEGPEFESDVVYSLDSLISVDFENAPLEAVVAHVREHQKIRVALDRSALKEAGVPFDIPISVTAKDVKLRSFLNLALDQVKLTWTIRHETLLISTPEVCEKNLITRAYGVNDLIPEREVIWTFSCCFVQHTPLTDLVLTFDLPGNSWSWDRYGGNATISKKTIGRRQMLIVKQTPKNHHAIAQSLAQLRSIGEGPYFDTHEVPLLSQPRVDFSKHYLLVYPLSGRTFSQYTPEQRAMLTTELTASVSPESWKDGNSSVDLFRSSLIINAKPAVHDELETWLKSAGLLSTGSVVPVVGSLEKPTAKSLAVR